MLERLARTCFRRRRRVVLAWIVAAVAFTLAGGAVGGDTRNDFDLPGSESDAAADLLAEGGFTAQAGYTGQLVFAHPEGLDPAAREEITRLVAAAATVEGAEITGPFPDGISPDGTVAIAEVGFGDVAASDAMERAAEVVAAVEDAEPGAGVQVEFGGEVFYEEAEFSSEALGLVAAVVILLAAFGSVLAMGLPIVTALSAIICGMAVVSTASAVIDIPDFAPAVVAMVAIGVGIDYALLIVTRYREELVAAATSDDAVARALATAGRAVLFAGTTVIVSLCGLFVVGLSATRSLAMAVTAGVLMVLVASVTLLPALLGFAGTSIDRLRVRRHPPGSGDDGGWWYRWSVAVQRRPVPVAVVGLVVLLTLSAPALGLRLGFGDAGNRPETDTARRAYDLVTGSFGPGFTGPLFLAVDRRPGADPANLDELTAALAADPGVGSVAEPITRADGGVSLIQVVPTTSPQDGATADLVHRLRNQVLPPLEDRTGPVLVGGATAAVVDFADLQADRLPVFVGVVLTLSFLLLTAVFRSLIVALKAVIMNLLSISAAYGLLVVVFQWGWGAELLGVGEPGPIEAWVPMMLFAIVFGLSMDYEVFLLSRIREDYDRTGDNATAVAHGLAKTARLITAAAGIMVLVFGGFVLSVDRSLQLFGFGLAAAIALDASLVRLLLVPATMELLGNRNWWLPTWLDRLLPTLRVEGAPTPTTPQQPVYQNSSAR